MTASVALPRRRLTVGEFQRMAESGVLGDDERLGLWDADILEMTPIHRRRSRAVRLLTRQLPDLAPRDAVVEAQHAPVIDADVQVSPDVMRLRPSEDGYRELPGPGDVMLLVEVTDASVAFERGPRAGRSAAVGVPECCVVDVPGGCVRVMRRPGAGGHGDVHRYEGDTLMAMGVPVEVSAPF